MWKIEDTRSIIGQYNTLAGLLAGLSFAGVVELLGLGDHRTIVSATVLLSTGATVFFLVSLFGFSSVAVTTYLYEFAQSRAESDELKQKLQQYIEKVSIDQIIIPFIPFWLGSVLLLVAIGCAGWIYSRIVGIVSTVLVAGGVLIFGLIARSIYKHTIVIAQAVFNQRKDRLPHN